jgi:hypothetical protein
MLGVAYQMFLGKSPTLATLSDVAVILVDAVKLTLITSLLRVDAAKA